MELHKSAEPNLYFDMGEEKGSYRFGLTVKRTLRNRFKYWLFFQFFPFRLVSWDKEPD